MISFSLSHSHSVCAFMQPRIKTMERVLVLGLLPLALLGVVTTSFAQSGLLNSSKLEMFVDELLDMPKILSYEIVSGVPRSKSLEIGMFNTTWVSGFGFFLCILLIFIYLLTFPFPIHI